MGEQKDKLFVLWEIRILTGEIVALGTYSVLDFGDTSQWRFEVRRWICEFRLQRKFLEFTHNIISSKNRI